MLLGDLESGIDILVFIVLPVGVVPFLSEWFAELDFISGDIP